MKGCYKSKKIGTYAVIGLYFFFSGVEYAVILPSLNKYLLSLNASTQYIGYVMSAFSLTGLISGPLYGVFTDKTGSTKATVMFSDLFEIAGNLLYFFGSTPGMILGARLLSGVGSGSASSIFGMISRSTTEEERTKVFSRMMSLRQFGLLLGPAFNIFLIKLDFYIGPYHVDKYTAPGIFMAIVWILHLFGMLMWYKELHQIKEEERLLIVEENFVSGINNEIDHIEITEEEPVKFGLYVIIDLMREEVIVCLSVTFILLFAQCSYETLVTPLTLQLFDWGELPNSIFFCVAGATIIISFLFLAKLSNYVSDRQMLLVGASALSFLYAVFIPFLVFALQAPKGTVWVEVVFCIHMVITVFNLPYVFVPQASLFSKVTSKKYQAFNQGIRMVCQRVGQILGPLWAGAMLNNLIAMSIANLFVTLLINIMVIASYKRLNINYDEAMSKVNRPKQEISISEKTPLLRNGVNA